jgi:hypothetical protein
MTASSVLSGMWYSKVNVLGCIRHGKPCNFL